LLERFTLKRLWTIASLTPVGTRLQLARSLVLQLFLYRDVIFPKVAVGLRDKLRLAYNSCARALCIRFVFVFGIRKSEHILGYSARILGLPLGWYYSFRICCQMYGIVSNRKSEYLYWELQFGRSARLSDFIVRRPRSLFGVRFSGIVCLPQSGASLVRGDSEVDAGMRRRKERFCFSICKTFRYLCHLCHCVAYFCKNPANK
jgi:hypothetical protein